MSDEFRTEFTALLERLRTLSEDERNEFLAIIELHLSAHKNKVAVEALRRDEWKELPPESREYRDLIFDLCFAQSCENPIVQKQAAVMAAINFLNEKGFPSFAIRPLRDLVGDLVDLGKAGKLKGQPGRRPMAHNDQVRTAYAAAAVTVLSSRENTGVEKALKMVCRASSLDRKWLRQFRFNLLRGKGGGALVSYKMALCKIGQVAFNSLGGTQKLVLSPTTAGVGEDMSVTLLGESSTQWRIISAWPRIAADSTSNGVRVTT